MPAAHPLTPPPARQTDKRAGGGCRRHGPQGACVPGVITRRPLKGHHRQAVLDVLEENCTAMTVVATAGVHTPPSQVFFCFVCSPACLQSRGCSRTRADNARIRPAARAGRRLPYETPSFLLVASRRPHSRRRFGSGALGLAERQRAPGAHGGVLQHGRVHHSRGGAPGRAGHAASPAAWPAWRRGAHGRAGRLCRPVAARPRPGRGPAPTGGHGPGVPRP